MTTLILGSLKLVWYIIFHTSMDCLARLLYRLPVETLERVGGPKWPYSHGWQFIMTSCWQLSWGCKPAFLSLLHVGLSSWLLGFTHSMMARFRVGVFYEDKSQCTGTNCSLPKLVTWPSLKPVWDEMTQGCEFWKLWSLGVPNFNLPHYLSVSSW